MDFRTRLVNKYKIVPDGYTKFYKPFDQAPPPVGDRGFPPASDLNLLHQKPLHLLEQRYNPETNQKEWAAVNSQDPSKVLKWYGVEKPEDPDLGET